MKVAFVVPHGANRVPEAFKEYKHLHHNALRWLGPREIQPFSPPEQPPICHLSIH